VSRGLVLAVLLGASTALHAQTDLGRVLPAGRAIRVVAFGDAGSGRPEQKATADAIARRHAAQPFSLGLTMGDNFYRCGVRSVTDPKWQTRWESLYAALGVPFYPTLGNHDYGRPAVACLFGQGSADVQVAYSAHSQSWRMPARYYTYAAGAVRFIALDTPEWSDRQREWVAGVLRASAGEPGVRWRIVYGHYPVYSSGKHGDERHVTLFRRQLLPVLKAGGADLYVAGHDHHLERLQAEGIALLVTGGGGADIRRVSQPVAQSVVAISGHGFLELDISTPVLTAQFLNTRLEPLDPKPLRLVK
jgi:hypothetical protein